MEESPVELAKRVALDVGMPGYPEELLAYAHAIAEECAKMADAYKWFEDMEAPPPDESNHQIAKIIRRRFGILQP